MLVLKFGKRTFLNSSYEPEDKVATKMAENFPSDDGTESKPVVFENRKKILDVIYGVESKTEVYCFNVDLKELVLEIADKLGQAIPHHQLQLRNGEVVAFIHPTSKKVIKLAKEYEDRKAVCDKLYQQYPSYNFEWRNQSYTQMGMDLMAILNCNIPFKSQYDSISKYIHDEYYTRPLNGTLSKNTEKKSQSYGYDIKNSYPTAIKTMKDNYNVFSVCDTFVLANPTEIAKEFREKGKVRQGEYLVDRFQIWPYGIFYEAMVHSHNSINYLLEKRFLKVDKIKAVNCHVRGSRTM